MPIYFIKDLLQYIYGDFYVRVLSDEARLGIFPTMPQQNKHLYGAQQRWFREQPYGFKTGTLLVLIAFCYVLQKYFQDGFISWLYGKWLLRNSMH